MLKTYEFWQIDERFLLVSPDRKLYTLTGMESLPESETGYLAYAYLDETMRIAFLGFADPEKDTYEYFESDDILVAAAAMLPSMLVRIVKPTSELNEHPFVKGVLEFHEADALRRSTLAIRSLDPLRDPVRPEILTACFIRDEKRKEKAYEEEVDIYREAVEAMQVSQDEKGGKKRDKEPEEGDDLPEPPAVTDDMINFVQIKDLMPSNNGTWRAVLLENLPGTRLKRKGDDVDISVETVTVDDAEHTVLFVNHTMPVEGTDISVQSYKPTRLPWRLAYELDCASCAFTETYYLGRHGEDSLMFKEILSDIRLGRIDPPILIDLVQRDDCEIDFSRELYRCRYCGTPEVMKRLRLITPDKTLSAIYNCLECGERMSLVKRGHIASLDCPDCRKPLNLVSEKQWSGVLETEATLE